MPIKCKNPKLFQIQRIKNNLESLQWCKLRTIISSIKLSYISKSMNQKIKNNRVKQLNILKKKKAQDLVKKMQSQRLALENNKKK